MAEYIDRQAAIKAFKEHFEGRGDIMARVCEVILNDIPVADVRENVVAKWSVNSLIVRCKDCKFWGSTLTPEEIEEARTDPNSDLVCDMWMSDGFSNDDYCSWGERRSNND